MQPGRPVITSHQLPPQQHCLNTLNIIHHDRDLAIRSPRPSNAQWACNSRRPAITAYVGL